MDSVKAAGASAGRAARRTKLRAEIEIAKNTLNNYKKEFGVNVWKAMVDQDQAKVEMEFKKSLEKISQVENSISVMHAEIDAIDREAPQ